MTLPGLQCPELESPSSARSGTVFLITSDGKILSLPIPSRTRHDPLNWSVRKRTLALLSIGLYSWIGSVLPQGAGLVTNGLELEFAGKVSCSFWPVESVLFPASVHQLNMYPDQKALWYRHSHLGTHVFHGRWGLYLDSNESLAWPTPSFDRRFCLDVSGNTYCCIHDNLQRSPERRLPHGAYRGVFLKRGTQDPPMRPCVLDEYISFARILMIVDRPCSSSSI